MRTRYSDLQRRPLLPPLHPSRLGAAPAAARTFPPIRSAFRLSNCSGGRRDVIPPIIHSRGVVSDHSLCIGRIDRYLPTFRRTIVSAPGHRYLISQANLDLWLPQSLIWVSVAPQFTNWIQMGNPREAEHDSGPILNTIPG